MEGSPVRGQSRWRNPWVTEALDIQSFQSELVRTIANELFNADVVFGRMDPRTNSLELPSWMTAHLETHPALYKKLQQGELVGISHVDAAQTARDGRSSVLLFPVISDGVLHGAIALVSPMDGPQLLQEDLEMVRHLAQQAGPILARLEELHKLREENTEMKSLLRMRAHLQSNVAHELRTPLAAVRGYTRMILDGRVGEATDTQKEYLRIVGDNTTRLINLVNWMTHILEISGDDFLLTKFDLRQVWKERASAAQPVNAKEQIPDEPFHIVGDPRKMARVFDYLLAASAKLATPNSNLLVQFSRGREREITVKVADAGAVVPPELLTGIFDRSFSSVPMPLAQKPEGSELGLSEIYDIIGMHGGRFFVNSKTGQGVTFLFTLPAVEVAGEEKVSHEQAVNSGS
jgi:signal transduction histidine kinase